MKKGQILEGYVETVEFPAKGIVRAEGRKITVKNTLEGQKIRFRVTKARSSRCEGQLLEVLEPAAAQQEADCPHFGECGGCTWRMLPYEDQLALKEKQVLSLLRSVCEDPHFEGIKPSPVREGYRNKMEFSFGDLYKDGPMSLGMHKRGSFYDVVTVSGCRIIDSDFRAVLECVLGIAEESGIPFYRRMSHLGYFRHLLVRKAAGTGEILISLVTTSQLDPAREQSLEEQLTEKLQALPLDGTLAGILHTWNDSPADTVTNERTKILSGRDYITETMMGLTFRISPFSFFQTNTKGAEVLYETARSYAGEMKRQELFDLYSGTGTIAQILAPVAHHVTGVEIVEEAVEAARENARLNGLDNCSFIAGDVLQVVDQLPEKPDLMILDPPRDGVHPKALPKIIRFGVERIVYISCKPTSLIRDLEVLQAGGYSVERSCCVDMFPRTSHIETVCLLTKKREE